MAEECRSATGRESRPRGALIAAFLSLGCTAIMFMVQVRVGLGLSAGLELGYLAGVITPIWCVGIAWSAQAVLRRTRTWLAWVALFVSVACPGIVFTGFTWTFADWLTSE